jgi:hypothetical protein
MQQQLKTLKTETVRCVGSSPTEGWETPMVKLVDTSVKKTNALL